MWAHFKSLIRLFTTDYNQQLNLDRLAAQTSAESWLDWVVKSRDSGEVVGARAKLVSLLIHMVIRAAQCDRLTYPSGSHCQRTMQNYKRMYLLRIFLTYIQELLPREPGPSPVQFDTYLVNFSLLESAAVAEECRALIFINIGLDWISWKECVHKRIVMANFGRKTSAGLFVLPLRSVRSGKEEDNRLPRAECSCYRECRNALWYPFRVKYASLTPRRCLRIVSEVLVSLWGLEIWLTIPALQQQEYRSIWLRIPGLKRSTMTMHFSPGWCCEWPSGLISFTWVCARWRLGGFHWTCLLHFSLKVTWSASMSVTRHFFLS